MKKIGVLIDFTPTSLLALRYAIAFRRVFHSKIILVHVASKLEDEAALRDKMLEYTEIEKLTKDFKVRLDEGAYMQKIPRTLEMEELDLVVIGTHGQRGIYQNIFGANILKLIQAIPCNALVVQDHSPSPNNGLRKILYPIGAHQDFERKAHFSAMVAEKLKAEIEIFCVYKSEGRLSDQLSKNLDLSESLFEKKAVNYRTTLIDSSVFSIGYAREIIKQAESSQSDLITMMSQAAPENSYFGSVDKTNILLNPPGIPVLCTAGKA